MGQVYRADDERDMYAIYLASPFFNEEQMAVVGAIEEMCHQLDIPIFSPSRDAGVIAPNASAEDRRAVFNEDVKAIHQSRFMLARVDDRDPGTIWEMGYAYALEIPTVAFTTVEGRGMNIMLSESVQGFIIGLTNLNEFLASVQFTVEDGHGRWRADFSKASAWRGGVQ